MDSVWCVLVPAFTSALGWWFGDWNRRRIASEKLVRQVADRYLEEMRPAYRAGEPEPSQSDCAGAMLRAGVALLEHRPYRCLPSWGRRPLVSDFCERVARSGLPDPWLASDLDHYGVPLAAVPAFLHAAGQRGARFEDDIALYRFVVSLATAIDRDPDQADRQPD